MMTMMKYGMFVAVVMMMTAFLLVAPIAKGCDFAEAHRRLQQEQQNGGWSVENLPPPSSSVARVVSNDTTTNATTTSDSNLTTSTSTPTPDTNEDTVIPDDDDDDTEDTTTEDTNPTDLLQVQLHMISNQARGLLSIDMEENEFSVSKLEVAMPTTVSSIDLDWYSALSLEEEHLAQRTLLAAGGSYEAYQLVGNETYAFDDLQQNLTSVGAILLCERASNDDDTTRVLATALIQKLVPGPAADLLAPQPTYFDNCLSLGKTARLRWTLQDGEIDVGLEYTTLGEANTYMAWGPASPGVQDRLMGGSDVIVAGFREPLVNDEVEDDILSFAQDYYIKGYEVCTLLDADLQQYDGVCRDSIWTKASSDEEEVDDDETELQFSHVMEGVAFLRIRRPLNASTPEFDHDITPGTKQHFVWARGPLDPEQGIAEVQFHGYQYGQLKDIDVGAPTWDCPPLEGVLLEEDDATMDAGPSSDDEFANQFDQSIVLQGDVVELFWTLMPETSQVHLGARTRTTIGASKWMSIAVGSSMTDAWAWVATLDGGEQPQLLAYRMSGLDATTVRLVSDEADLGAMMSTENSLVTTSSGGRLAFETIAKWPLPGMDPSSTEAPFIYAVGPSWTGPDAETPKRQDEHSIRSKAPTVVDFTTGVASVGPAPKNSMLIAHGAFMWLAWLFFAPLTGIASRYMRDDPCVAPSGWPIWIQLHKYFASAVLGLTIIGFILSIVAIGDAGLRHFVSAHAKVGMTVVAAVVVQNGWGTFRPPAGDTGLHRRVWELAHRGLAFSMLALSIAAVITGSISLEDYDLSTRYGVPLSIGWLILVVCLMALYEFRRRQVQQFQKKQQKLKEESNDVEETTEEVSAEEEKASPWISNHKIVYLVPLLVGVLALVVLTAIAFNGSPGLEEEMIVTTDAAAASASLADVPSETALPTQAPTTQPPIDVASEPVTSFAPPAAEVSEVDDTPPANCTAVPLAHVGDGWCDDHTPFNTAACNWDGGDCCDSSASLYNCKDPDSPNFGKSSPKGWANAPIPRNPRYTVSREETEEAWVITYNNYYGFGLSKDISDEANRHADFLSPDGWFVDISGLVENPMTIDVPALVGQMHLEERMYRHRCVEAWSITSPWIGFPLSKLLDIVKPTEEAAIVQFVSWKNFSHSRTQQTSSYPWPYTEALTMAEARNELTMLTVGNFQKPLTPSQGAPIRLNLPWKYGFKSIKSIEKISFLADTEENRRTFWGVANPREYSFWANINPDVPHRRWSQATERHFVTGFPGTRLPTKRMNGYHEQVDYMYDDIDDTSIYF